VSKGVVLSGILLTGVFGVALAIGWLPLGGPTRPQPAELSRAAAAAARVGFVIGAVVLLVGLILLAIG
jgi:hypothetical protein